LINKLWKEYVFNKQTIRELGETYKKDRRTIKLLLESYKLSKKNHTPREVHLIVDATYFGERKEETSWCVVVARDMYTRENLWWTFTKTETTTVYAKMRSDLEELGYIVLSVTGDGFGGIKQGFSGIPYQMCHVHMERIVTRGTTRNPQTKAGQVLLAFVKTLPETDSHTFNKRIKKYFELFGDFLNERTINIETGRMEWTHRELRRSALSLLHFEKYLFTFERNIKIPKTTNSLEGHFRHINEVVAVHCGLKRSQKEKVLHSILLAGTIAPSKEKLKEIM